MKNLIALMAMLICGNLFAQQITAVDVSGMTDGTYVLTVDGGTVTVAPLTLIRPGEPTPQKPQPAPSGLAGIVKAEAAKLPASQQANKPKVAAVYLAIAAKLKAGLLTVADVPAQTKSGVSAITGDGFDQWRDFGTAVNEWLAENDASNESDIVAAYQTIATALNDNAAINWLPIIVEVLEVISSGEKLTWATLIPIILEIVKGLA